jgi:hypothetical protein
VAGMADVPGAGSHEEDSLASQRLPAPPVGASPSCPDRRFRTQGDQLAGAPEGSQITQFGVRGVQCSKAGVFGGSNALASESIVLYASSEAREHSRDGLAAAMCAVGARRRG